MSEHRCPICRKPATPGQLDFPFCSKHCRLVDLGSWLDEKYRISRPIKEAPIEDTEGSDPPTDVPVDAEGVEGGA